jgi:hypothetical protein
MNDDDNPELWKSIEEDFRNAYKERRKMDQEFERLLVEPCQEIPQVGDRVIVASGFLGMGHLWVRHEALVLEVAQTSYKVRFLDYRGFRDRIVEMWVHPALITDRIHTSKTTP